MIRRYDKQKALTYMGLILASFFSGFPIIWMILMSVRPNVEIFTIPPKIIPDIFTLKEYVKILSSSRYMRFFFNSYTVGLLATLISLCLAIFAGYGFSRFKFRSSQFMNLFIVMTQTIPPISLIIPYFIMINRLQLYDTYGGLIITYISFCLPYAIMMLTAYFNTIPRELDEAALIDGASYFRTLWSVVLPSAIPGVISVMVYTFILAWNEFLFALTLTRSYSMRTVPVGIALEQGEHTTQWNTMLSMAILGSLPVLIIFILLQKYFISGLTAGAVKE